MVAINSISVGMNNVSGQVAPGSLIPEVYEDFKSELLEMFQSLETGEEYESPFFPRGVDPFSSAFPIVQQVTFSNFDQIFSHLNKAFEIEKKWTDMLAQSI